MALSKNEVKDRSSVQFRRKRIPIGPRNTPTKSGIVTDEPNSEGQDDAAETRPTVTVPKFKRGDEVIEWMEVDKEWWEYAQKAKEVNEQVKEMALHDPGVNYIETSQGEERTEAGWTKSCITVLVDDDDTADRLSLPDEIDGVPITVKVGDGRLKY